MHDDAPSMPHHRCPHRPPSGCVQSSVPRCGNCSVRSAPSPHATHCNGRTSCRPSVVTMPTKRRLLQRHHPNERPLSEHARHQTVLVASLVVKHRNRPPNGFEPSTVPKCANSGSPNAPSPHGMSCDGPTFCRPPAGGERSRSGVSLSGCASIVSPSNSPTCPHDTGP